MFLVAEVWRGRMRRESVKLFTDFLPAHKYYSSSGGRRVIWQIFPDSNRPMKPLTKKILDTMLAQAQVAEAQK